MRKKLREWRRKQTNKNYIEINVKKARKTVTINTGRQKNRKFFRAFLRILKILNDKKYDKALNKDKKVKIGNLSKISWRQFDPNYTAFFDSHYTVYN